MVYPSPEQNRGLSGVKKKNDKKIGFTLAETLIALVVTGVVAAIMIPALSALIQTRVREHQVAVAQRKFNKAAEIMILNGKMGPYYSNTNDFVNELQKYLKIVQVCKVGNSPSNLPPITTCFGENYETITINTDDDTINLTDIQTGSDLGINTNDDTNDWTSNNIGILTIDGTRMILSYNSKCPEVAAGVYQGNAASGCIAGLVDVDGDKKPNQPGKDAYLIGSAKSIGNTCIGQALGLCLSYPIDLADILSSKGYVTDSECRANRSKWGLPDDFCTVFYYWTFDSHWLASAARECGGLNKIASVEDVNKIVNYIYDTNAYAGGQISSIIADFNDNAASRAAQLGLPDVRTTNNLEIFILTSGLTTMTGKYFSWYSSLYTNSALSSKMQSSYNYGSNAPINSYIYCKL